MYNCRCYVVSFLWYGILHLAICPYTYDIAESAELTITSSDSKAVEFSSPSPTIDIDIVGWGVMGGIIPSILQRRKCCGQQRLL